MCVCHRERLWTLTHYVATGELQAEGRRALLPSPCINWVIPGPVSVLWRVTAGWLIDMHLACYRLYFWFIFKMFNYIVLFFKDFIYLFLERRREGEREGEKHPCVVNSRTHPHWGCVLQPRHVPWVGIQQGIEPATLSQAEHSIHWATPARALTMLLWINNIIMP